MRSAFSVVLATLVFAGCIHGREGFLKLDGHRRAAFEMKCPESDLKIVEINSTTVGVEGCGQSAVYKLVQTDKYGSDWLRD